MMLISKGSTRTNLNIILKVTLVLTVIRILLSVSDSLGPSSHFHWNNVPSVMTDENKAEFYIDLASKSENGTSDANVPKAKTSFDDKSPKKSAGKRWRKRKRHLSLDLERIFGKGDKTRLYLFFFTNEKSPFCRRMERLTYCNPEVERLLKEEFYPVKVPLGTAMTRTQYEILQKYGSTLTPALSIVDQRGKKIHYTSGYMDAIKLYSLLRRCIKANETNTDFDDLNETSFESLMKGDNSDFDDTGK